MAEPEEGTLVPSERRLETPDRTTLLANYARAEELGKTILTAEIVVGLAALIWLAGFVPRPFGVFQWLAFAIGGLGVFRWFLEYTFLSKKRLEEIRPDAQFGEHNRDSLVQLSGEVFERLGLNPRIAPVFLTRAKDINAQALRCELWPGMHLFNGVFLNRSIIHLLDGPELASVIGHELGHVVPYSPILSRCYLVHAIVAGVVSSAITAAFPYAGTALVAPMAVLWIVDRLIAWPHSGMSRSIEFLCDDYGAQAAGVLPALSSDFKIAVEQETRQQLLLRVLEARKKGARVSLPDLIETYEEAIPFGKADPESFERELQRVVADRQQAVGKISLGGYLRDLQGGGDDRADEWIDEQLQELELLERLPLLSVDRGLFLQGSRAWSLETAESLATVAASNPAKLLVRLPAELDDRSSTHPSATRRLLFLWRNRAAYPLRCAS